MFTVNIEKLLDAPPPFTVTRFLSVAPLPDVGPVMVVFDGMFRVPLVRLIVCGVANMVGSNVMFAEPSAAAIASAARSVPGPLSAVVVTTMPGIDTVIPFEVR